MGTAGCHTLLICAHLWEVLLCQKVPCVPWVLWEYSLPRISQINTDGWLRSFAHGIHGIHRSLGVLLAAWVWQDAIPSYICVNPCYLWESLLNQKVLCVLCVLWAI